MIKKITRENRFGNNDERDVLGNPMNNPNVIQEQPNNIPEQPNNAPISEPMNDDLLKVISNIQETLTQLNSRMDKVENKPIEDNEQEIPVMEEVNVGGENKTSDFNDLDEKNKMKGQTKNPDNIMQETLNKILRKMEELTGITEIPKGKKSQPINDTTGIPQTQQPPAGIATSGGGFDSDDKINETDAKNAESEVQTPKKDYDKKKIVFNKKNKEAAPGKPLSGCVGIQKEGEDPTIPQPEETQENPDKMDMSFNEKNVIEETYNNLRNEMNLTRRQSVVFNENLNNRFNNKNNNVEEYVNGKNKVNAIVKEYLQNPGVAGNVTLRSFGILK
jgi:hypothetical protein